MSDDRETARVSCEEVLSKLYAYLDREVDELTTSEIDHHLEHCRECFSRAEFEKVLRNRVAKSTEKKSAARRSTTTEKPDKEVLAMVAVMGFSADQIREAVKMMYSVVARNPAAPLHFPVGAEACRLAGYDEALLGNVPAKSLESFAGVGNPFRAGIIRPGDTVLDVGAGSGTDVLIASRMVGDTGRVIALDLTRAMRSKLEGILRSEGVTNVEILAGDAEDIPLPDACVDVVTSNGVLNLVPDKRRAINQIFRVMKPGGRVQIADIVIARPVTPDCEDDPALWAECVVGATVDEIYLDMFRDAGFESVEVIRDYDYFANSPSEETREVAKQFGAHGMEVRMRRADVAPARLAQWSKRLHPARLMRQIRLRGLWGSLAFAAALIACYGTLAAVALLSALGVGMALNEGVWAGAIVGCAALACVAVGAGWRKHRSLLPLAIALSGLGVLSYAMFVRYHPATELVGFILLGVATWLDFDRRRWAAVPGGKSAHRHVRRPVVRDGYSQQSS